MIRLGLKLWSVNVHYINEARALLEAGFCDYVELSAIPGSFGDTARLWRELNAPFIIHAPHFMQGLNFSLPEKETFNRILAEESYRFADVLKASKVIFHPGIKGSFTETARQMKILNDGRMLVENKPRKIEKHIPGLAETDECVGYCPAHIKFIAEESGAGFCLDIGHAFCAANASGKDKYKMLGEFENLNPHMYHISDGEEYGIYDRHYGIGKGSYDFKKIFSAISNANMVTLETEKTSKTDLNDFKKDIRAIKAYF